MHPNNTTNTIMLNGGANSAMALMISYMGLSRCLASREWIGSIVELGRWQPPAENTVAGFFGVAVGRAARRCHQPL
jgi:hypothetical protein